MDFTFITRAQTALKDRPKINNIIKPPNQPRCRPCITTYESKRRINYIQNNNKTDFITSNWSTLHEIQCRAHVRKIKDKEKKQCLNNELLWKAVSFSKDSPDLPIPKQPPSPSAFNPTERCRPKLLPANCVVIQGKRKKIDQMQI